MFQNILQVINFNIDLLNALNFVFRWMMTLRI